MNETLSVLETRRSCRNFKPDAVPRETLQAILRAGMYAATGMGKQSPLMVVVENKELRDKISAENARIMGKDAGFDPFYGAPIIVIVLANKNVPTHVYDGSLVMGNLMNAAHALGVDSIWIHRAKDEWGIEGDYEGIGHCALGYRAAELPAAAPRKDDYVHVIR